MQDGRVDMSRRLLFILAILASSFLIFLVQPMVGKRILPWFGGTASVWTLCLAFYQTTLFLGYAYAHCLIRFASPVAQLGVHALVVGAAFIALPVLPSMAPSSGDVAHPSLDVLTMLASNVALPFITLASTGPLVQIWFARTHPDRSPYPLYAVSNLGSFAALLAYPFVFEPRLALSTTGTFWSYAFVATALAVLLCAFVALLAQRDGEIADVSDSMDASERPSIAQIALWILLSGCAVILLMGVTNSVCLDVASVPFLWIPPLATYLLTYILCFASEANYRRIPYVILTIVAFGLTLGSRFFLMLVLPLVDKAVGTEISLLLTMIYIQVPAYCALLFGGCMILHGELYRLRPPAHSLTAYYLCISGGGALGGLFVGLLAPILFNDYYETRIGLGLAVLLFVVASALAISPGGRAGARGWRWRVGAPLGLIVGLYALLPPTTDRDNVLHQERGFFGVLKVMEFGEGIGRQLQLVSGSTLHGLQFIGVDDSKPLPTSYYGRATGIAAAFAQQVNHRGSNIGLIGLGVGTLSTYGKEGDSFRYYEIDPAVAHIARDAGYFSYLAQTLADVDIVLGDARLAIDEEQKQAGSQEFDLLVLDAFTSDAIPVHLLTVEAFRLYKNSLAEDGVLAVHISNRYFDLFPLVSRVGFEVGLKPLGLLTSIAKTFHSQSANWVFLSRNPQQLSELAQIARRRTKLQQLPADHVRLRRPRRAELSHVRPWTDDYSDLLAVLKSN